MFFVGRQYEIARIENAIARRRNVIVRGKYGIGRTALVREAASRNARRWTVVFTDFSEHGSDVCAEILKQLVPRRHQELNARQLARAVATYTPPPGKTPIIVLDNIAKLTRPKLQLLRRLHASNSLLFIAIVERFVPEDDVMGLRVVLDPAVVVAVDYLDAESSVHFLEEAATRYHLGWSDADIEMLARAMHGYPLELALLIAREKKKLHV